MASSHSARSSSPQPGGMKWDVPGSDRQLGGGHPLQVAHDAAATQAEELDGVLEPDGVAVADDDHGGRGDAADGVRRPGVLGRVEPPQLLNEAGEVARARRRAR